MKAVHVTICLFVLCLYAIAQHGPASPHTTSNTTEAQNHNHSANTQAAQDDKDPHAEEYPAAVSYEDLKKTLAQVERMREATAKYRDVNVALANGYVERGVEIKGMGIHFVKEMEPETFNLDDPPMLVYEKAPSAPGGFSLVGVMYILKSQEGPDGQPVDPPFAKPLAIWHKHAHVCMLSKIEHSTKLSLAECQQRGGHFNDLWVIHAWVWKDSPVGVFSPKNPVVATMGAEHEIHAK